MKIVFQRHQKNKDPNKHANLWFKDSANNIQKKNKILFAIFTKWDYFINTDLVYVFLHVDSNCISTSSLGKHIEHLITTTSSYHTLKLYPRSRRHEALLGEIKPAVLSMGIWSQ